jgi:N-acetyl-anhydromuramyl-L-alanine amidase AmpD
MKRKIVTKYLVVHTSATEDDWTAADVRMLHTGAGTPELLMNCRIQRDGMLKHAKSWADIGYHYVIDRDGTLHGGRDEWRVGAHVKGINNCSVGICCIGHGDKADFSEPQKQTLYDLLITLMQRYKLSPMAVIGHREINKLVNLKRINGQYATDKSCPGNLVNMTDIRRGVVKRWIEI